MDREFDTYGMNYESDPVINPMLQYEQGYMYYKYLTQQLEYKIKLKEYEKIYGRQENR